MLGIFKENVHEAAVRNTRDQFDRRTHVPVNAQIAVIHETAKLARNGSANISSISVGIDGDTAMVGDLLDDDRGRDAGAVYVFERDATGTWLEVDKLTASDAQPCDRFGRSVAVKGNTLIVGRSVTICIGLRGWRMQRHPLNWSRWNVCI